MPHGEHGDLFSRAHSPAANTQQDWGDGWSEAGKPRGTNGRLKQQQRYAMGPGSMVGFGPKRESIFERYKAPFAAAACLLVVGALAFASAGRGRSEPAHYTEVRVEDLAPAADVAATGHTHHGAPGRKRRGTPAPAADEDEFAEAIATPKPHTNKHSFTDSLDLEEEKPEANDDMPADDLTVVDEATAEAEIAAVVEEEETTDEEEEPMRTSDVDEVLMPDDGPDTLAAAAMEGASGGDDAADLVPDNEAEIPFDDQADTPNADSDLHDDSAPAVETVDAEEESAAAPDVAGVVDESVDAIARDDITGSRTGPARRGPG